MPRWVLFTRRATGGKRRNRNGSFAEMGRGNVAREAFMHEEKDPSKLKCEERCKKRKRLRARKTQGSKSKKKQKRRSWWVIDCAM